MAIRQHDIRIENQRLVLELLRRNGMLTRSSVAERTGLTVPTVSAIFRELQARSLIKPADEPVSTGGRRAEAFCLNGEANRALAVHVGVHELTYAIVELSGRVLHKEVVAADQFRGGLFVNHLRKTISSALEYCRSRGIKLRGVGISFPGVVDEHQRITLAPNIGGEGTVLADLVEGQEVPVYVDNDARLGALAEIWWRAGQPEQTIAFLMVDYGVGVGLAMDGRVHAGKNFAAGDIGHAVVDPRGERCACGQFGCLETFISYSALVRRITDQIRLGRPTVLLPPGAAEPEVDTLNKIIEAAQAGDEVAVDAVREAGRYLAIAVSMLNVIIAPDVVYIGGTFSRVYDLLVEAMQPILHHRGPELHRQGLRIEPAVFLADTSLMGAAALVFEHMLSGNHKET